MTTLLRRAVFLFIQQEPNGVADESLWRFWQEYAYRSAAQVLALRSTFTFGRNNVWRSPYRPAAVGLAHSLGLQDMAGSRPNTPIRYGTTARNSFSGTPRRRRANKLLPLDGISIGGNNTVRGFVENQLVLDQGKIVGLEI